MRSKKARRTDEICSSCDREIPQGNMVGEICHACKVMGVE